MRYGVIPTRLTERLGLWFGRVPFPIADCLLPLLQTRSLMAAVRLGITDVMGTRELTPAEIADACALDRETVEMLLRVLVSARYVRMRSGRYRLSPRGRRTLLRGAADESRGYVLWNYVQWEFMEHLEEVVRTGRGIDFHDTMSHDQEWRWYQEGMVTLARPAAPVLARLVPVKRGARALIDIGGSHGLLGAAICRRHSPMKSVVVELPAAVEQARAAAREAGTTDVVEHRALDVLVDDIPPADVALLANVIHHFTVDEARALLGRVRQALTKGGTVAVWEFDRPAANAAPELAADASALFFRLTSTSQVLPAAQYAAWFREAGFARVKVTRSATAPLQVLITGRRR